MDVSQTLRSVLPLIVGLVVGGIGATLFRESLPGPEGSHEERANKAEFELKQALTRISVLEVQRSLPAPRPLQTVADDARRILDDIREGRPVSPNDIFRATRPLLKDFAPLFDRLRLKQQQESIDSMTGELARKYDLSPDAISALKSWFEGKARENGKAWTHMIAQENTGLEDLIRASRDVRADDGLDEFMEGILSSDKLGEFKKERLAERTQRVQQEADMKVQRLDAIAHLTPEQREQAFIAVARGSKDYNPSMGLDGANRMTADESRQSLLDLLDANQRDAYEAARNAKRAKALKELESIGLTLPPDWDMFEDEDF